MTIVRAAVRGQGATGMYHDLAYTAQFEVLRIWIANLDEADLAMPSSLPGWTVAELIGHLAGTGNSIAALRPAAADAEPQSIGAYVANYSPASEQIAALAKDLTAGAGPDLLDLLDAGNTAGMDNLTALGGIDRVVLTRRGPILLSDFLDTRVIELVVHAGDLARSLPHRRPPKVLSGAAWRVVAVMRDLLSERASDPAQALAAAARIPVAQFIELGAGRGTAAEDLPAALREALPLF